MPYKKILVGLDGSQLADVALAHAATLAKAFEAELVLIHVVPSLTISPFPMTGTGVEYHDGERTERDEGLRLVREAEDRLRKDGIRVSSVVEQGDAAGVIVDYARSVEVDLIVLGSRGWTGMPRWMLGSVADRVARSAGSPVLLITSAGSETEPRGGQEQ